MKKMIFVMIGLVLSINAQAGYFVGRVVDSNGQEQFDGSGRMVGPTNPFEISVDSQGVKVLVRDIFMSTDVNAEKGTYTCNISAKALKAQATSAVELTNLLMSNSNNSNFTFHCVGYKSTVTAKAITVDAKEFKFKITN